MEHAPKTYLHEFIDDDDALISVDDTVNLLLANFNSAANEENAEALPIRAAVASILMEGTHSLGGKKSCMALIDAGQHALKMKSTNIHEDAKV